MEMNLQKRFILITAFIFFLVLSINIAVLMYISYNRYKQAVLSEVASVCEVMTMRIDRILAQGMSVDKIEGLNESLERQIGDNIISYYMILDKEGKILFHSDEKSVGKTYKDSTTLKALASDKTLIQKWDSFYDIASPLIDAKGKNVGVLRIGVRSAVIKKELYNLLVRAVSLAAISFLLFAAIIYLYVSRFITVPITEMEKIATRVSSGDFTENVKNVGKDEILSLSGAINSITLNIREAIVRIRNLTANVSSVAAAMTESPASVLRVADLQKNALEKNARNIAELGSSISSIAQNSESLYESAEEEAAALEKITASISHMAESANIFYINSLEAAASVEEMMASIKETAHSIEILSAFSENSAAALDEVNASIREIQHSAEESVKLAENVSVEASEKGLTSISKAVKGIEDIKASVNAILETITRLEKRSKEIGSILNVIDEVAGQTNLLSLNAAILAAQAGEHGKSFAVVADEIKRLAEKTSMSTREIAELITAVQAETRSSVEITSKGIETVDRGVKLFRGVNNALNSILESSKVSTEMSRSILRATAEEVSVIMKITNSIKQMTEQIEQISGATKEQSKGSSIIVEASEKIKTGSEQLKRVTGEQYSGIKQISSVSENVSNRAKQIKVIMESQKLKSNEIIINIEKIQKTTAELSTSVREMDKGISSLNKDAKTLLTELQKFKI
jgi:methyl-accepting chemotaxis protein